MSFQEHGVLLYLSKDLYIAFIKLQADRGLGRSYAGLLPLVEGFYRLGYLSKEAYEDLSKRYSKPLIKKELTMAQLKEREQIERLEKHFLQVYQQWDQLSEKSKRDHMVNARRWTGKVKNAQLILNLEGLGTATRAKEHAI
jgi:hypothetical protein